MMHIGAHTKPLRPFRVVELGGVKEKCPFIPSFRLFGIGRVIEVNHLLCLSQLVDEKNPLRMERLLMQTILELWGCRMQDNG